MKNLRFVVVVGFFVVVGCSGNDTDPSDPQAHFNWTANGRAQSAAGTSMDGDATNRMLNGAICSPFGGMTIYLREPLAVGVVPVSQLQGASYFESNSQWDFTTSPQKGSGTVTLTAVSPRIVGTFQFTLVPLTTGSPVTAQGSFDMDYNARKVCPG